MIDQMTTVWLESRERDSDCMKAGNETCIMAGNETAGNETVV